jgi:protease YdgD
VDINLYPWSSIGKIGITSLTTGHFCSGAVIGPNEFLTAGHCVYNQLTGRFFPAGSVHFLLGYAQGEYRAYRVASRYIVPPAYTPSKLDAAGDDWAVIYIEDPFPSGVRPLRLGIELPLLGTLVKTGGYPAERQHMMTADKHCRVRAISFDGKLITHDCIVHHGDSGGPLLSANEEDEGLILGFNVLAYSPMVELEEQSKEGAVALSAASITQFLASRVVGSLY